MKYRKQKGLLCGILAVSLLVGCGDKLNAELTNEQIETTMESYEEQINGLETGEENKITDDMQNKNIAYEYEQSLQIIEDNYRNYYEIFVYSFYDSDNDGIGDLKGVTEKLDYIEEMGFNGIWLMPVFESPTYHKYDVIDYRKIDPVYGSNEDMKELIEACHARGIRVIIDFVINHTSSQNSWFVEAKEYLRQLPAGQEPDASECPYVDYYHFSREKLNGTYYAVPGTDWYYEGSFWSEMPDLNLACEPLRAEIEEIADEWIDRGVDGFRMDATMHFEEGDTSFNAETMRWLYEHCLKKNPDFYMVSEVWASETTIADYYSSMTPSMFNFDVADVEGKLIKAARGNYGAAKFVKDMQKYEVDFGVQNPDYIDAPFITNHDMGRVANVLQNDVENLKMACGMLMSMNGSPFVYYGEEIGMKSAGTKDENKRLPMIWSYKDQIGMTEGPKDADPNIVSELGSVEEQLQDPSSLLSYYKRAIRIRNENPEIARGKVEILEELTEKDIAVITKEYEGSKIAICYNTGKEPMEISLQGTDLSNMTIRGYLTVEDQIPSLQDMTLFLPAKSIVYFK